MADKTSVLNKGSDVHVDVCCSTFQDEAIHTEAGFNCHLCIQFYCGKWLIPHRQLLKKHTTYGKGEKNKWPVFKAREEFLEKCEVHADKKIELFCDDHDQLCSVTCVLLKHRQCTKVTIIADSVKTRPNVNLRKISARIHSILKQLANVQNTQKSNSQSLQANYNDRLEDIRDVRNEINLALDKLENATLKEMGTVVNQLKDKIKADADICTKIHDELKQLRDIIRDVENNSSHLAFVAYHKSLNRIKESEIYLKDNSAQTEFMLKFHANTEIVQYLSKLSGLEPKCAIDLGGGKLYMGDPSNHKLLTLTRDGTVLSTFTDPELQQPMGIHVTPAGKVLVCGFRSNSVIQVDGEGKKKIATLVTQKDGMINPLSVACYKNDTIIVGQWMNNNMLLFSVNSCSA